MKIREQIDTLKTQARIRGAKCSPPIKGHFCWKAADTMEAMLEVIIAAEYIDIEVQAGTFIPDPDMKPLRFALAKLEGKL